MYILSFFTVKFLVSRFTLVRRVAVNFLSYYSGIKLIYRKFISKFRFLEIILNIDGNNHSLILYYFLIIFLNKININFKANQLNFLILQFVNHEDLKEYNFK